MKASEVLKKALELFKPDGSGWTQDFLAKDHYGLRTYHSKRAVSYCSVGAIRMATCGQLSFPDVKLAGGVDLANKAIYVLRSTIGESAASWNDDPLRTFQEVQEAFLEAIKLAEAEEAQEIAA